MEDRVTIGQLGTTGQARAATGLSAKWLRHLAEAGQIRAVRGPHGWLFDMEDIGRLARERATRRVRRSPITTLAMERRGEPVDR